MHHNYKAIVSRTGDVFRVTVYIGRDLQGHHDFGTDALAAVSFADGIAHDGEVVIQKGVLS